MLLKRVEINLYKSFLTPQYFETESGITVLVGKNESGKSAALEAIAKHGYFEDNNRFKFDKLHDYPRTKLIDDQKIPNKIEETACISCDFELDDELVKNIEAEMGVGVISNRRFTHSRKYNNRCTYSGYQFNFSAFLKNLFTKYEVPKDLQKGLLAQKTYAGLKTYATDNSIDSITSFLTSMEGKCTWSWDDKFAEYIFIKFIDPQIPKMWYFDEYFLLPSEINIHKYINRSGNPNYLTTEEYKIVGALFDLAGIDPNDMIKAQDFEEFKAKLEATSNKITDAMFEYWTTNKNLEIEFASEMKNNERMLYIRIKNKNHRVTLPLKNRSKGFAWFFSFLVWFSKIEGSSKNKYILLLDEPGLNLHASAQDDLLRFIREKLADNYQVIYTTHSPFMIDSNNLVNVRTVYDSQDPRVGSIISNAIQEKDPDTLFPLQAALGYDIAQNLFVNKNNLLVEGVSDLMYLTALSGILQQKGRVGLPPDMVIIPVGGLDKVASFVSLLRGNKLNIICLLDNFTDAQGKQRLDALIKQKIISEKNIIYFGSYTSNGQDIEDLFDKSEYLVLFNSAFAGQYVVELKDIHDHKKPILPQINTFLKIKHFNHYLPAESFLRMADKNDFLSDATLDRFEKLFVAITALHKK